MTSLVTALAATTSTLFAVVLEVALKGTLLMAAAAVVTLALRHRTASLRHLIWSFSLLAMLAIPVLSLVLPRWEVGPVRVTSFDARNPAARLHAPAKDASVVTGEAAVGGAPVATTTPPAEVEPQSNSLSIINTLALLWLGGLAAGLITIIGGLTTLRRLSRNSQTADNDWQILLAQLMADLRIRRKIRLLISNSPAMPATWGVFRPTVLLPADARQWDAERRRVVLLHELAHVQRNDSLMQIVAQIGSAVYWFHPGVWYVARELRNERELASDEFVLQLGINACDYAAHLLDIATLFRAEARSAIAGVAMARLSQLEGRLEAILSETLAKRSPESRAMKFGSLLLLGGLTVPIAAMQPWRNAEVQPEVVASMSSSEVSPAPSDTFRWKGVVPAGKWVTIYADYGDMRAELSTDGQVEVFAGKVGEGRSFRIAQDRSGSEIRFCAINAIAVESSKRCETSVSGGLINGLPNVRVDFVVKIPPGVGIALHTGHGNIMALSVRNYVWATADRGNIRITTTDLAEASTESGSIFAEFGRRSWRQDLEFLTESGDVTVVAPSDAAMMIQAETRAGNVTSDFVGQIRRFQSGQRMTTTTGSGGGMLTLRTGRGTVRLRRGAKAVAEHSDMSVSRTGETDPKPNPNPDPEYNPDPNLNPDVEEMAEAEANPNDPTGERVPVNLPANFLDRFRNDAIRGWPDAPAISRFRDVAATHRKQHAADLVRERSEWALTLVRNGEVVAPLISALSRSDWRERAYAAWALGEARDPRAVAPLTAALRDSHWRVRMHSAAGLQRIAGAPAVDPLIRALSDEYWQVRISAVDALAAIGDSRAVQALQRVAQHDPRWIVRDQARNALERMR